MEEFRGWKMAVLAFLIFLLVTILGYTFERMLYRDGVNRKVIFAEAATLTGIVVASLFLQYARSLQTRRRLVQARLEVIADMNHHIRNALQVRSYGTASHENQRETEMMRDAISRIEWALREVLPGYLPETHVPQEPAPPPHGTASS